MVMILLVWAALLMASPGADCRMLVDSITGGARSRRIGDRSYPVPVRSTSLLLDEDMDSYRVDRLPFLSRRAFPTSQWAGEVPIPYAGVEDYGHMFFWLFEPAGGPSGTAPLVVWLNGGPGCSSLMGLFVENGPFRVQPDLSVEINPYSWHNEAYVLYVDQPLGTGMSYVNPNCSFCDFVHNQTAVNEHMYSALQSTMRIFPFLRDRSVYLTGESYAGHYIPSIADYIVVIGRGILPAGDHPISIAGLAIGNGWSVPVVQYNYGDFAYNIGLISKSAAAQLTAQYSRCRVQEARQDYSGKSFCNVLGEILAASGACPAQRWVAADDDDGESGFKRPSNSSRNSCFGPIVNYYDTRLYADAESNWPNGDNTSVYYLNLISVRKAIHSRRDIYVECSAAAGQYLAVLDGLGVQAEIESLLGANIPITFYNGQYDLICNHIGNGDMLSILKWSGADEFQRAAEYVWTVPQVSADGESIRYIPAGYARFTGDRRLQFVVVIGASHMVPYDVPRAALDLIRRVLRNESFGDYRQDLTWNFDDSRASAAEQEIDDLLWRAYEFIFRSPFSTDYVLILVCALFVTTMVCVSRGTCSRSTIYAYTRIPSNSDT